MREADLDISLEMCKAFLRDSYLSKSDPPQINLEHYIADENLLKYSRAKIEKEAQNLDITGIDIDLVQAEQQDDAYLITLKAQVRQSGDSRFGEATLFLVKNLRLIFDFCFFGGYNPD